MRCHRCGRTLTVHLGTAVHVDQYVRIFLTAERAFDMQAYNVQLITCDGFYTGECEVQVTGHVGDNGEVIGHPDLIPLARVVTMAARRGKDVVLLPPKQKNLDSDQHPKHDPGE